MACCRASKCCCCINLRTGTLVIGVLALIGSILGTISGINLLAGGSAGISLGRFTSGYAICEIIGSAISIVTSALLIWGVRKRKPNLMLPWIVIQILFGVVVTYVLAAILMAYGAIFTTQGAGPDRDYDPNVGLTLVVMGAALAIAASVILYFTVVVISYRIQLRDELSRETDDEAGMRMNKP